MSESRPPQSSIGARILLVLGSLLVSGLMLAAFEGALRVIGMGDPDASQASRLKYQQIYLPVLAPGERADGTPIYHTIDSRLPYQWILRDKPANGLRVFTFGGSATAGLGFSPNVTFARDLERMLERAHPDRHVEVVNLGIVALASRQVKYLVADACRRFEPDLVVVYSGNNEFLEEHARKYAEADAAWLSGVQEVAMNTNLYRLVNRAVRGPPQRPSLAEQDFSQDDLRLTQAEIIRKVEMSPAEIDSVLDDYEENLQEMVDAARAAGVPILFSSVGSNWRYRGRSDLPAGWLDELVGEPGLEGPQAWDRAAELLEEKLEAAEPGERHEWLYKRAALAELRGDWASARRDFRASMNEDPHLRRALDAGNERVREVAQRNGAAFVDGVAVLAAAADHGIVGFGEFYDYVHFTPKGALVLAARMFEALPETDAVPPPTGFDADGYLDERLAWLASLEHDPLELDDWLGVGFDVEQIHDRDLWKYDRLKRQLDERIAEDPDDVRALVYRGNGAYFEISGGERAERDYRAALEAGGDDPAIEANLARLRAERRP
ncbi:MAG: GDSL-type esterase/lipase family protein [Myxococcota bacterium]